MKILIIEDESGIVNFLRQGLQEEGYDVIAAEDGKEGFAMAEKYRPDIILLDWMLPESNGLEVCKLLRKKKIDTPVIFLTAKDTVQETIEGLRAGANDYIKKPFSFDELLERIKVQLRATHQPEELAIGPVVIFPLAHKVTRDGAEVNLTHREFELLLYLVKNRGSVCSRKDIIGDVWDIHFEYDTGVIDVFINAIRKKLNLIKEEDFIKTIRGVGYIIES
ncbi:DNA-binding response regulator [Flavobacterium cyanobacteriorum]|uniref:DNA-binding response regulator n=1 Tax=Flavobacterium cyanobacteriorum TaxID=2022802 RepID=A0A255Z9F9_9FLAO|nr:response regulator transcription factor [Flavobacterium cyanobacteriorum]OYQ38062.1 DNA-binding response regulator [Flavobacterium cyanobacteriorum]